MNQRIISVSNGFRKGILDDNYTLYDDGTILHEFDKSIYSGGQNHKELLSVENLTPDVKKRLLDSASDTDKDLVRSVLKID